jgi:UDP-N-acetylmuramate--alanine ligase
MSQRADVRGSSVTATPDGMRFDVVIHDRLSEEIIEISDITLPMHGAHNVQNALAAMAIAHDIGILPKDMRAAINDFSGVQRRFTTTGVVDDITIIDDYGHHPTEISAVLRAAVEKLDARSNGPARQSNIIAVFQPHRYSRVADLFDDFCRCFNDADAVIVSNVYAAGEDPIEDVDKAHLIDGMRAHGMRQVYGLDDPNELAGMVHELATPGDLVICLGAGDITKWAHRLPGGLRKYRQEANQS